MNTGTTPNHLKPGSSQPKSTGSHSKFAKPRSLRKQDANTTVSGVKTHHSTLMGSTSARALNRTVRQNLDITLSGAGHPNIKSGMGPPTHDHELEFDLAYNDYMQALLKQQLVKKTIEQHENILNDQLLIQSEHFHKLENTLHEICDKIESLKEQSDVVELLQMLKSGVNEIEELCVKHNTHNRLNELDKILTQESNLVSTKNIRSISSQEEYDQLLQTLHNLKCVMEKIVKGDKKFKEVHELSDCIREFNKLNLTITTTAKELSNSNKRAEALILKQTSDFFAQQGGYA